MMTKYSKYSVFQKNKIIKLKQAQGKCEICKKPVGIIHHIDNSKDNHSLDNLIAICHSCHKLLHPIKRISGYYSIYGMTFAEMTRKYGGTIARYRYLHKKGKLKELLEKGFFINKEYAKKRVDLVSIHKRRTD